MSANRKTVVVFAVLVSVALLVSVYAGCAHFVATHVSENDSGLYWSTPGYSFLPWPTTPSGLVIQVTVPLSLADLQYYQYVIQSGVLLVLSFVLWVLVAWQVWRFRVSHRETFFS